jgi:hypothetical protein
VNPKKFFAELKRRNVYKVAVAYVIVAGTRSFNVASGTNSARFRPGRLGIRAADRSRNVNTIARLEFIYIRAHVLDALIDYRNNEDVVWRKTK